MKIEPITIGQLNWLQSAIQSGIVEDRDYSEISKKEAQEIIRTADHKFKETLKKR